MSGVQAEAWVRKKRRLIHNQLVMALLMVAGIYGSFLSAYAFFAILAFPMGPIYMLTAWGCATAFYIVVWCARAKHSKS